MNATKYNRMRGFTLIELLVVISIIVILVSLTTGGVHMVRKKVDKSVAKARFSEYIAAIDLLKNDNGYYPTFGEQPSSDGDLIFPQSGDANADWTDFWKTIYALKSPEESGGDPEKLGSKEARELGNPRRKQHLKPSDENHYKHTGGELDWSTIKGMLKESRRDRERIYVVIDMDDDGKFENPDPRTKGKYHYVNKSIGFFSREVKGGGEGKILFKTWDD